MKTLKMWFYLWLMTSQILVGKSMAIDIFSFDEEYQVCPLKITNNEEKKS